MDVMDVTLRHLKIFTAVYETSSFTKAGQRLYLAQPSVSLAIRELEDHYGVPLFDRIRHSIYPTPYGETLYHYAVHVLSLLDEMESALKDDHMPCTIRLGSSITIGNTLLPGLVERYRRENPAVRVEISINNSNFIERDIVQSKIDFALIESEPKLPQITAIPFLEDHLCTVAPPGHPLSGRADLDIRALSQEQLLCRERGSSVRELVEGAFLMEQLPFNPVWESSSTQAIIAAVEQGLGVATLPCRLVERALRQGSVVRLHVPELDIRRHYNIIYYQSKYLTSKMLDFFALCTGTQGQPSI